MLNCQNEMVEMKILITGANFNNKGAQSMLFIAMDELRKRYHGAEIYFETNEEIDFSNYKFKTIGHSIEAKDIALNNHAFVSSLVRTGKDAYNRIFKKRKIFWPNDEIKKTMEIVDMVIDISGYCIGSNWNDYIHNLYIKNIQLARKYELPMYIMPQSFGPFDYDGNRRHWIDDIRKEFQYPKVIFARERKGYEYLHNKLGLNSVC